MLPISKKKAAGRLGALEEAGIQLPAQEMFEIILATLTAGEYVSSVAELCRLANVSRSAFYRWLDAGKGPAAVRAAGR